MSSVLYRAHSVQSERNSLVVPVVNVLFQTVDEFVHCLKEYIHYWNNERISLTLNGMSPVQYRTHSQAI